MPGGTTSSADKATAYPHTHVLFGTHKKMDFTNPRKLDYLGIHPHMKKVMDQTHAQNCWLYHEKAPVLLTRSSQSPIRSKNFFEDIINAPNLVEAIKLSGVEVKSVADVRALRTDKAEEQIIPPLSNACSWTVKEPERWNVLFVTGATNTGKTRWALSLLESPLLVSHLEDLKQYRPGKHDGIVFDDVSLTSLTPTQAIHLVDYDMPRTIRVLYGSITLPAGVKKIFTSNESLQEMMPVMSHAHFAAILRRVTVFKVQFRLYDQGAPTSMEDAGTEPEPLWGTELDILAQAASTYPAFTDTFNHPTSLLQDGETHMNMELEAPNGSGLPIEEDTSALSLMSMDYPFHKTVFELMEEA